MAYTPFALLAATIMVTMAFGSYTNIDTEPVETEYDNSVFWSWGETQASYAVDSLSKYVQLYSGDKTESEVNLALETLTKNGTYQSNRERISTYRNWTKEIENLSPKLNSTKLSNLNADIENLTVRTEADFNVDTQVKTVEKPVTSSKYIKDVEDPLLESTSYSRKIDYCGFDTLANKIFDNSDLDESNGTIRGKPIVEPTSLPTNSRNSKIVVSKNITNYTNTEVQDFAGYFSRYTPTSPENYNDNYAVGAASMPNISTGNRAIIKEGFWKSNFHEAIPQNCYIPSNLEETPSIYDRINESTRGDTNEGIFTVLNPQPGESEIGYERLDNSSLNIVGIETVSESEAWPDFNMSESLAESEGLTELVK